MDDLKNPDPEMLKMLDVLEDLEILEQEPEWELLENMNESEDEELEAE